MVADRAAPNDGVVYMPVEQYLALDDNTDGLYEYWHGLVIMLRPPSSAYSERAIVDMAGGSPAHAALSARLASLLESSKTYGNNDSRRHNKNSTVTPK